jgi:hypothetical protein
MCGAASKILRKMWLKEQKKSKTFYIYQRKYSIRDWKIVGDLTVVVRETHIQTILTV